MKNLLLTGGFGFIGKNIAPFLSRKYHLFVPSHRQLDLLNAEDVVDFINTNKIDYIVHAANIGGTRAQFDTKNVVENNLRMFFNIVHNINLVDKIIYFGSGAEFDKIRPIISVDESKFDTHIPIDDYGFYKYICSKYTQLLNSKKLICLRLFGIYGPYENYLVKFISNSIVKNLFQQNIIINQDVYFDYMYVEDLNQILNYFLNNQAKYSIYNVSTGAKASLMMIVELVNKLNSFHSNIVVKKKGLNNEYTASNRRLVKEIPTLKFTPLDRGVKKLFAWYNNNVNQIDRSAVINDQYIKLCSIKKNE